MAGLSFLRTPTIAEQALPFAVLFGSMIAFLNLSRRWSSSSRARRGCRSGNFWRHRSSSCRGDRRSSSVAVYNPASTSMKQRSDTIESEVFGGPASPWGHMAPAEERGWSSDHPRQRQGGGRDEVDRVEIFNFDDKGNFVERVDATSGELHEGYWEFHDARSSGRVSSRSQVRNICSPPSLTAREVSQAFVAAETVSFWSLPGLAEQTERAGLDPTAYLLRYQELLALPLTLAAMVLVAACFSLRFFRMGGIEYMVSGGVAAGFVLYVATKVVNDLGSAGFISAVVAGWSPGLVGCLFGVYVLLQQEDG